MKIERVQYRKLKTFGNYQNETVGASALVEDGETPEEALDSLKKWCDKELEIAQVMRGDRSELQNEIWEKQGELDAININIEAAKQTYARMVEFLEKHGVKIEEDGLPF